MNLVILLFFLSLQSTFVIVGRRIFRAAEGTGIRRIDLLAAAISTGNLLLLLFFPTASPGGFAFAAVLLTASSALFAWSVASVLDAHLPFIHEPGAVDALVTSGPFRFVRNPFYVSYLLAYGAIIPATDSFWTYFLFALVYAVYLEAVRLEENSLRAGPLAEEYAAYARRTGRFIPFVRRGEPSEARSSL